MKTRKDYLKDFESVIQQEIKNYNDTVLSTNISLDKCRKSIEELNDRTLKSFAYQDSKFTSQYSDINKIEASFNISFIKLKNQLDELCKKFDKNKIDIDSLFSIVGNAYVEKQEIYNFIKEMRDEISILKSKNLEMKDQIYQEIERIYLDLKDKFESLKQEISNRPSEAEEVKKDLEKKIDILAIDSEGILKEIRIYKKESFVIDKKIENLYTLIERLDKRVPL